MSLRGLRSGRRCRVLKLLSRHPKGELVGTEDWFPIATQVRGCDLNSRASQRGRREAMMAVSGRVITVHRGCQCRADQSVVPGLHSRKRERGSESARGVAMGKGTRRKSDVWNRGK